MTAHALLSASSADRWLSCPPSARLNEKIIDVGSDFAALGTKAHELCERTLISGRHAHEMSGDYPHDMRDFVQAYVDYVRSHPGTLKVEQRLSYEKWVKEGFGTCDAVVIDDGKLSIIDFKYSVGLRVDAPDNAQLMLYALAALDAYDPIWGPIHTVKMAIHQPRLDHIDEHEMRASDLYQWADTVVRPIAVLAWEGKGEFKSGDHCQFCKSKHTCRTLANEMLNAVGDMHKGPELANEELAALFPKLSGIVRWANDLTAYVEGRAIAGTKFAGLKLVAGRSVRKFIDDETKVIARFESLGLDADDYLTRKLIGIGAAETLVGKKEFANEFADLLLKPEGVPTLVPVTDKRSEISDHETAVQELLSV